MNRLILALLVIISAMASQSFAQAKAVVSGAQPSELMFSATNGVGNSRGRSLTGTDNSDKNTAPSTRLADASMKASARDATPLSSSLNALNQIYRIGVGDVLDVRLRDLPTSKSTLFTVIDGGLLDYPLSSAPVRVTGLTPDEVASELRRNIKVLDNPQVSVTVRDYSSHSVTVTGAVGDPGTRFLRREATPLYVILAEAQPRSDAVKAIITRQGATALTVNLKNQSEMATMVLSNDLIKIVSAPVEPPSYFYAGGALNTPGQKSFHNGLTLTQAIVACGGVTRLAGTKVKLFRQGGDGRLVAGEYNLRQIEDGKIPDPVLKEGDRIDVSEAIAKP